MDKKAFTLVELIVVVTILAILGLISFISIQGFTIDARNSKRVSDIRSLITKITIENSRGTDYKDIMNSNPKLNSLTINGEKDKEGFQNTETPINWNILRENGDNFKDPSTGNHYPFAFAEGNAGGVGYSFIQLAYVEEKTGATKLVGNYYEMQPGDSPSLFTNESGNGERIPNDYIINDDIHTPSTEPSTPTTNDCEINPDCSLEIINGVCGNGGGADAIVSAPTSSLCEKGTPSEEIVNSIDNWTWSCNGSNGGTNETCSRPRAYCATQPSYTNATFTTGTPTSSNQDWVKGASNCGFSCKSGRAGDTCSLQIINGVCGNGGGTSAITTAPTSSLCTTGTASAVTNSTTTWTWSCSGSNGGTNETCSRPKTYCATQPSYTNATFTTGTPTSSNQDWVKGASNCGFSCKSGRTGDTCNLQIINGVCGNGGGTGLIATAPTSSLCTSGTASAVTNSTSTWTWSCNGSNGGTNETCSRLRAYCATQPSYTNATFTTGTPTSSNQAWVKGASNCGFSCKSGRTGDTCNLQIINGVCGNGGGADAITTAPTSSLCTTGTASAVTNSTNTWTWSCSGSNGGTNATGCNRARAYCATQPSYTNATFTTGTPTKSNQAWVRDASSCGFSCNILYTWDTSTNTCKCAYGAVAMTGSKGVTTSGTDIIIRNGNGCGYTIADRNLGATEAYNGTDKSSVRGNYYQWGKNIAYSPTGNVSTSTTLATSATRPSIYGSPNFIIGSDTNRYDWVQIQNDDLWGDTTNTNISRQGPCPTGRHVPSTAEWRGLVYMYSYTLGNSYSSSEIVQAFRYDLRLPRAGNRYTDGNVGNRGYIGLYWSSSPSGSEGFFFQLLDEAYLNITHYRTMGFSVRCFKN